MGLFQKNLLLQFPNFRKKLYCTITEIIRYINISICNFDIDFFFN